MNISTLELAGLLKYGMYVLLAATCLGVIVRALWRPADVYRRPCCGGCGHAVDSVSGGVCPECGGRYAKVGISTPTMAVRMRGSIVLALLAWTTLVSLAAAHTNGWLDQRAWTRAITVATAPTKQKECFSTELTPWGGSFQTVSQQREMGLDFRIALQVDMVTDRDDVESGACTMKLRKTGTKESVTLTINTADGSYTLADGDEKELDKGASVTNAVIKRWFESAGIDVENRLVKQSMADCAEIAELAAADPQALQNSLGRSMFRTGQEGRLQSGNTISSRGSVGGGMAFGGAMPGRPRGTVRELAIAGGALGAVWLGGCVLLVWRNRRALRTVAERGGDGGADAGAANAAAAT